MPTILILEHDAHARELARSFLVKGGHTVTMVDDGAEALERVAASPPDVVLTEIMVRKIDGLSLCKRIKGDPATQHVKVIVFSILAAMVRSQEAGADGFLKKPSTEQKLLDAVTIALGVKL